MDSPFPSYRDLMLPVLRAVLELGGSGNSREISESVIESEGFSEDLLAVTYEGREKSILVDRLDWARSYCKLGGVLESPKRRLFLVTDLGREIAALPDPEVHERLKEIDHAVRRARRTKPKSDANPVMRALISAQSQSAQITHRLEQTPAHGLCLALQRSSTVFGAYRRSCAGGELRQQQLMLRCVFVRC